MNTTFALSELPLWALIALGVLIVVQLTLQVIALVDLSRRPAVQVVSGRKWVWLVVIVLLSSGGIGAIVYLAAGRKPAEATDPALVGPGIDADAAIDSLYSNGRGDTRR